MKCEYYGDFRVKYFTKWKLNGSQKTRTLEDAMMTHTIEPSVYTYKKSSYCFDA